MTYRLDPIPVRRCADRGPRGVGACSAPGGGIKWVGSKFLVVLVKIMQVIPAIDLRGGCCVRLRQGDYDQETIFGDDPAAMAAHWEAEGATRIHLVDLDGAKAGRPVNGAAVRAILDRVGVPCQLGGGIRDEATIARWLDAGLERVIVGTRALEDPPWFGTMARKYPGRLVLGLD